MSTVPIPWLTQTKLMPPCLREDLVPRRQLLEVLHTAVNAHALTLVSAPPGYGKTTLLASLPVAFPNVPVAWLSLDEEDNDPARFLAALIGALQRLNPSFGLNLQALPASFALAHVLIFALPWLVNGSVLALAFLFRPQFGVGYIAFITIAITAFTALSFLFVAACFVSILLAIVIGPLAFGLFAILMLGGLYGLGLAALSLFRSWQASYENTSHEADGNMN